MITPDYKNGAYKTRKTGKGATVLSEPSILCQTITGLLGGFILGAPVAFYIITNYSGV
tara:strand:- start:1010 stop:1183 length:174 start_codon:yes stop_codon:yes gene_type:complete